jgi:hypothetical protein
MTAVVFLLTSNQATMNRLSIQGQLKSMFIQLFQEKYGVIVVYEDDYLKRIDLIPTYATLTLSTVTKEILPLLTTMMDGRTIKLTHETYDFELKML